MIVERSVSWVDGKSQKFMPNCLARTHGAVDKAFGWKVQRGNHL